MKTNKTLFIALGTLAIAGGLFLYFRNRGQKQEDKIKELNIPTTDSLTTEISTLPAANTGGAAAGAAAGVGKLTTGAAAGSAKGFGKLTR
jgi:hypothetical protein